MADRVAVMKRVWAGEKVTDSVAAGRAAAGAGRRPELLVGTMGPKTVRSAAGWADGLAGTTLDLDVDKQNELFDVARDGMGGGGKAQHRIWRRRSGSRSATATTPRAGAPAPAAAT